MPKSAIEKQVHNKYDNKQRKSQEKKTERLSFRGVCGSFSVN